MPCTFSYVGGGRVKGNITNDAKGLKVTKNGNKTTVTDGSTTATITGNEISIINNAEDKILARFQAQGFVGKLQQSGLTVVGLEEESHKEDMVVREMN